MAYEETNQWRHNHCVLPRRVREAQAQGHFLVEWCDQTNQYRARKTCHESCACLPEYTPHYHGMEGSEEPIGPMEGAELQEEPIELQEEPVEHEIEHQIEHEIEPLYQTEQEENEVEHELQNQFADPLQHETEPQVALPEASPTRRRSRSRSY